MAQNVTLPNHLDVDKRLLINQQVAATIRRGASVFIAQRTTSQTFSAASISFNPQLSNSLTTVIDPYMYGEYSFTVTITAAGLPLGSTVKGYLKNNFALRQYPIASICNNLRVDINNQGLSCVPNEWIHASSWYQNFINGSDQQLIQGLPIMPDQSQLYSDAVASNKNPNNQYFEGSGIYDEPRGAFNSLFVDVVNNITTWTFNVTIQEPFFHPLLEYSPYPQKDAFPYVNRFQITLNLVPYLSRMFSLDANTCPAITNIAVGITSATMVQYVLTLPLAQLRPQLSIRGYNTISANSTQISQTINPGQQVQITSQVLQIGQIPDHILCYVSNLLNVNVPNGHTFTDTFFSIQNIVVMFNAVSGILSDFSPRDLWTQCCSLEGSKVSWIQNNAYVGSVLLLDPAKLFRLNEAQAPGMLGNFQMTVTLTCTNISSVAVTNPSIFLTTFLPTILTTTPNFESNNTQGFVTEKDVLEANSLPAHPINDVNTGIYGAGSGTSIGDLFKKAVSFVKENKLISRGLKTASQLFPGAAPYLQAVQPVAENLGYGGRRATRKEMLQAAMASQGMGY